MTLKITAERLRVLKELRDGYRLRRLRGQTGWRFWRDGQWFTVVPGINTGEATKLRGAMLVEAFDGETGMPWTRSIWGTEANGVELRLSEAGRQAAGAPAALYPEGVHP